ncbi:hypothetical protein HMN09_01193300 [Mycena chlorophos]|uniref:Ricin B lectin domain-containing protein n=1 Tax=Mycena chlorophos TaxID=658473 RepID=A0A8H6S6D2_MYCCL|nr:hypothetical protein HMN09_01193300 [Mycena chlorophos]
MRFSTLSALILAGITANAMASNAMASTVKDAQSRAAAEPARQHTPLVINKPVYIMVEPENDNRVYDLVNGDSGTGAPVQVKTREGGRLEQQWNITEAADPTGTGAVLYTITNMASKTSMSCYNSAGAQMVGGPGGSFMISKSNRNAGWNIIDPTNGYAATSWADAIRSMNSGPITIQPLNHDLQQQIVFFELVPAQHCTWRFI